jgi:peroxiredoxin
VKLVRPLVAMMMALVGMACSRNPEPEEKPTGTTAQPAVPTGTGKPMPRMKEYSATPEERLGTLPEGVGIPPGERPPNAVIEDLSGKRVDLAELARQRGPLLLVFYRGGWCPYCNFEIHELTAAFPAYQKQKVLPVAISVDRVTEAATTAATYEIPFPVLSDPELVAHEAFRVVHAADDAATARLKSFGMDLEAASGKTHHKFAIPALFVLDRSFTVRWAHADPDYKVRPRSAQILGAIGGLRLE